VVGQQQIQEPFEVVRLGDGDAGFFEKGLQVLLRGLLTVKADEVM
jgi:hypothetical protein